MQIQSLLKRTQLFSGLVEDELEQLAAICSEKKLASAEIIIH